MALILCPNCGKKISDKAKKCPKCGYEMDSVSGGNISSADIKASPLVENSIDNNQINVNDDSANIEYKSFPKKLKDNNEYVVKCDYFDFNNIVINVVIEAFDRSNDRHYITTHKNNCLNLRKTKYYD